MKRLRLSNCVALLFVALTAFGGFAVAMQTMGDQIKQKAAAAKEAAARNQQALKTYSWIEKTDLSLKGEVKNTKIESCKYGPDGKVQKTLLTDPPKQEKKRGLRGRIAAKKTGEMKEELEASAALVQTYVPPAAEKLQAVIDAGKVSASQAGPGAVSIAFPDYKVIQVPRPTFTLFAMAARIPILQPLSRRTGPMCKYCPDQLLVWM